MVSNQIGPRLYQVCHRALYVLGPLLFSLHINDITEEIESEKRLFADDCVCYRKIKDK